VRRSALRLLRLRYVGFDGRAHRGKLVVARRWARPVVRVFRKLYAARFPIRRLKLVEAYGSNDDRVDLADDTSGFNCRYVGGTHVWSEHAYGRAIDVDPLENPEISHGRVSNRRYRPYRNRSRRRPGMIHAGDVVVRAFASIGWRWGGSWHEPRDYQHFSATGR
jgi:poly-gamma-glutamate synthesis protein (capsule biosynthesis protein)